MDLNVEDVTLDGLDPTYNAASGGGDRFKPRGNVPIIVHVKNTDAAPHNVTVDDPRSAAPQGAIAFNPDVQFAVPAGGEVMFPVTGARFTDSEGWINLAYDSVVGMTVALVRAIT